MLVTVWHQHPILSPTSTCHQHPLLTIEVDMNCLLTSTAGGILKVLIFWRWNKNGIFNKNSHKIAPVLWMTSKVTQRVKLSLNLLINGFRWRFPIMGSKISPRISLANLILKLKCYMCHITYTTISQDYGTLKFSGTPN